VIKEANLSQALHLINGDTITSKIAQSKLITGMMADKKKPEEIIEELYLRTLCRKPTADEAKKLADIVRRETTDPAKLAALASSLAKIDPNFGRMEDRLRTLQADLAKLPKGSKEAAAVAKQIETLETQLTAARKRYEANAPLAIYSDILWGLFNSTEFTFNH
jgi:hypothetical protein